MDTQDNLDLLTVKVGDLVETLSLSYLPTRPVLFSFFENQTCSLLLHSDNYEVISECHEEFEDDDKSNQTTLVSDQEKSISNAEYQLCPSTYLLLIRNRLTKEEIYSRFEVRPLTSLHGNLYEKLKNVLREKAPTCLFERSGNSVERHTSENFLTLHDLAHQIEKESTKILSSLHNALLHPITDIRKSIIIGEGKENYKSMQKEMQNPITQYTYQTYEEWINDENLYLYRILKISKEKLTVMEEKLSDSSSSDLTEVYNLQDSLDPTDSMKNEALKKKIQDYLDKKDETDNTKNKIYQIIIAIDRFLSGMPTDCPNHSKGKLTERFLMNHDYALLYRKLYLPLLGEIKEEEAPNHRYKPTSKLYEIYCLLLLIEALKEAGYKEKPNHFLEELDIKDQGLVFEFRDERGKGYLIYDRPIKQLRNYKKKDRHCLLSINSTHNRPDFQLLFFDKQDQFQYGIILDAKCRTEKNMEIYGSLSASNKAARNILDYLQFRYPDTSCAINMKLGTNDLVLLAPLTDPYAWDDDITGIHVLPATPGVRRNEAYTIQYLAKLVKRGKHKTESEDEEFDVQPL